MRVAYYITYIITARTIKTSIGPLIKLNKIPSDGKISFPHLVVTKDSSLQNNGTDHIT